MPNERKVIVFVEAIGDARFPRWVKRLTGVDRNISNGFAFEGSFIAAGRKHEFPEGTFLLYFGKSGSRAYNSPMVALRRVGAEGNLETLFERKNLDDSWALDVRDEIADILDRFRATEVQDVQGDAADGGDQGAGIATIITHDGVFHTDDVAAISVLATLFPRANIRRTRNADEIAAALDDPSAIVVDVGGGRYDHHQPGGNGVRPNGVPYASFGLVWRDFGDAFVRQSLRQAGMSDAPDTIIAEVVEDIDKRWACPIDAHDSGVSADNGTIAGVRPVTIQDVILSWNPINAESSAYDRAFSEAISFMKGVLSRSVATCAQRLRLREVVRRGIAEWSGDPADPVILQQFAIGWQELVCQTNALFVVFPRLQGGWSAVAVPEHPESKANRALAPSEWRGLEREALSRVAGVPDAIFCHRSGFTFAAESLESVTAMVRRAAHAAQTQAATRQDDHESQPPQRSSRSSRSR